MTRELLVFASVASEIFCIFGDKYAFLGKSWQLDQQKLSAKMAVQTMMHNKSIPSYPLSTTFGNSISSPNSANFFHPTTPQSFVNHKTLPSSYSTTVHSSTISLATFATDLENEITNKILKKVQLDKDNPNNIVLVTVCKLIDEVTQNINNNMFEFSKKFENAISLVSKQQQQFFECNNKRMNKLVNKLNNIDNKLVNNSKSLQNKIDSLQKQLNCMNNQIKKSNKIDKHLDKIAVDNERNQDLFKITISSMNNNNSHVLNKLIYNQNLNDKNNKKLQKQIGDFKATNEVYYKQMQRMNNELITLIDDNQNHGLSTAVSIQGIKFELKQIQNDLNQKQKYNIITKNDDNYINTNDLNVCSKLEQLTISINNNSSKLNKFTGGFYSNLKSCLYSEANNLTGNDIKIENEKKLDLINQKLVDLNNNLTNYNNFIVHSIKNDKVLSNQHYSLSNIIDQKLGIIKKQITNDINDIKNNIMSINGNINDSILMNTVIHWMEEYDVL